MQTSMSRSHSLRAKGLGVGGRRERGKQEVAESPLGSQSKDLEENALVSLAVGLGEA